MMCLYMVRNARTKLWAKGTSLNPKWYPDEGRVWFDYRDAQSWAYRYNVSHIWYTDEPGDSVEIAEFDLSEVCVIPQMGQDGRFQGVVTPMANT